VFLVQLLFPCALFLHFYVTNCSKNFPASCVSLYCPTVCVSYNLHSGLLPSSSPLLIPLTFQAPSLKRRDLISLVVSALVCLCTSLYSVLLIWHIALQAKNINHQQMHKEFFSSIVTHSYMSRPCWVIFRENFLLSLH
jgi:hypothetical protein